MDLLVAVAITFMAAVLLSGLASRSVLSTAVLFLAAGFVSGAFGWVDSDGAGETEQLVAELALFATLFADGMQVGLRDLRDAWRLPGRALLFGLPLALLVTAVLGWSVAGLAWLPALLVAAALSPTDPVFASAIVGREEIPQRLRRLLNVESGINDGLALPIVVVLLALIGADESVATAFEELLIAVPLGIAVPWLAIRLERSRLFAAHGVYESLNGLAIGLLLYALGSALHANLFLVAFMGGVTVATVGPQTREAFHDLGEDVAELLKLVAVFIFGLLISPEFLAEIPLSGYVFAVLVLVVARPLALGVALLGAHERLSRRELLAAAWFGPKGFASVVYGLFILQSGIDQASELFHLVAIVTALSILAHSSTDVLVSRALRDRSPSRVT